MKDSINDHYFDPWQAIYDDCDYEYFKHLPSAGDDDNYRFYPCPEFIAHWCEPAAWNRAAEIAGERPIVICKHDLCDEARNHSAALEMNKARNLLFDTIRETPMLDWLVFTDRPQDVAAYLPGGEWPNLWIGVYVLCDSDQCKVDEVLKLKNRVPVVFANGFGFSKNIEINVTGLDWVLIKHPFHGATVDEANAEKLQSFIRSVIRAGVSCWNEIGYEKSPDWQIASLTKKQLAFVPDVILQTKQLPRSRQMATRNTID